MTVIGFGTAAIGRPLYINLKALPKDAEFDLPAFKSYATAMIRHAYDAGIRYFDTAPGYGIAEEVMHQWLSHQTDPTIEVATKWGYTYTANFDPDALTHEVKDHSLAKLKEQWPTSQQLLPFLTTYQIHSATFESGILQNRVVLQQLATIKEVYGLRIGITTSGANQNEIILAALDLKVRDRSIFDTFQVTYNIFEQRLSEIIHLINRPGLRLIIKEAMANGRVFRNPDFPYYDMNYSFCEYLAQKYNVGVDAIALRFVIDSLEPAIVLSGANDLTQLHQNMKAASFRLTTGEIEQLRDLRGNTTDYWNARKNLAWQ